MSFFVLCGGGLIFEAVTPSGDCNGLSMVEESIKDGGCAGDVTQESAPFINGPVAGHDGGAVFVASHDDFKKVFGAVLWEVFESHVVDDNKVWLEVLTDGAFLLAEGLVLEEIANQIKDGTVKNLKVHF